MQLKNHISNNSQVIAPEAKSKLDLYAIIKTAIPLVCFTLSLLVWASVLFAFLRFYFVEKPMLCGNHIAEPIIFGLNRVAPIGFATHIIWFCIPTKKSDWFSVSLMLYAVGMIVLTAYGYYIISFGMNTPLFKITWWL